MIEDNSRKVESPIRIFLRSSFLLLLACLVSSCASGSRQGGAEPAESGAVVQIPRLTILLTMQASFVETSGRLPRPVYVFPPLRVNRAGQPIENYEHYIDQEGVLRWRTASADAEAIKLSIERMLEAKGFNPLSFDEFSEAGSEHGILVFNPYYSREFVPASQNGLPGIFVRLTGATFPSDLDPARKREILNHEAVALHNPETAPDEVVRRAFRFAVDNLTRKGEIKRSLSLLN